MTLLIITDKCASIDTPFVDRYPIPILSNCYLSVLFVFLLLLITVATDYRFISSPVDSGSLLQFNVICERLLCFELDFLVVT